jgi:hypothetical protein
MCPARPKQAATMNVWWKKRKRRSCSTSGYYTKHQLGIESQADKIKMRLKNA